jgi:hypothetical protein
MRKVLFSAGLGLLAPVAFILGAEPFEVPGQNSLKEILAGSVAVALYFAACQFWLARGSVRVHRINWPVLKAMIASLLAMCLLPILLEGGQSWLFASLPMLVSGCIGGLGGALLAPRKTITVTPGPHPTVDLAFCRRSLLTSAVLLVAVSLVIVAAVIPPVADTFPGATRAVPAFWIIVFFHVLAAAALGSTAVRTTTVAGPERPPFLGLLVLLLVLSACALAGPGGAYFQEGPAMRTASVLLFICAGSDLIAALLFITAVSRLPERT